MSNFFISTNASIPSHSNSPSEHISLSDASHSVSHTDKTCNLQSKTLTDTALQEKVTKGRMFNPEWELKYFVVEDNNKLLCLLCKEKIAACKVYNVKRHYQSVHKEHETQFLSDEERLENLTELKRGLRSQQTMMRGAMTESYLVTLASYKVVWLLAQNKRPFSDSEIVKNCILEAMKVLTTEMKNSAEILNRISNLQLSRRTFVRRISDISENLSCQLKGNLDNCLSYSLALDESTDICDVAQLCVWVRFVDEDLEQHEEMLALRGMHSQTRGEDIRSCIKDLLDESGLSTNKLVSITSDGAPSMVGKSAGFVNLMRQSVPHILSFHCIIHQEVLCSKIQNSHFESVMNTVVKIVNIIRGKAINHRQFVQFLDDVDAEYGNIIYHSEVRWLSRGKVLERFINLLPHINDFLDQKNIHEFDQYLCDVQWVRDLAFLTDVTGHLNVLNLALQGKQTTIEEAYTSVKSFQSKLILFIDHMQKGELRHFHQLRTSIEEEPEPTPMFPKYVDCLRQLQDNFNRRFVDFDQISVAISFLRDPKNFPLVDLEHLSRIFNVDCSCLETGLIELQSQLFTTNFCWKNVKQLPLRQLVAKILSIFSSTYTCESTFSAMNMLKSKARNRVDDFNLEHQLRCAVTQLKPSFEQILSSKDLQISH